MRGCQEAVLQGMIHIAPKELYEVLQKDLDRAVRNDSQVFFEGLKRGLPRKVTPGERKIKDFFLLLFDLYPVFAAGLGISSQKEEIAYPKDAICADITFDQFIRLLYENGFRCNLFWWLLTLPNKEELKKKMEDDFTKEGGLNALMDRSERWSFSRLFVWFFFRKAMPIILGYRNEVAVAMIRAHSDGRDIYIHYGEKHVEGLVRLLKRDGWVVKKTTYIDLKDFC